MSKQKESNKHPAKKVENPPAKSAAPAPAKPVEAAKPVAKAGKPATSTKSSATITTIVAKYDVGHGNTMHIRGENAGLNWVTGIPMVNAGRDVWVWTTDQIAEGMVTFKLLINDEGWLEGDNLSASAGETTTLTPTF